VTDLKIFSKLQTASSKFQELLAFSAAAAAGRGADPDQIQRFALRASHRHVQQQQKHLQV
jgi:hypothetical protein